jgi:hypothetical protein
MEFSEIATIAFTDCESGDSAVAIVRQCGGVLGVALSLKHDGDVEVFLDPASARKLASAIAQGVEKIERAVK